MPLNITMYNIIHATRPTYIMHLRTPGRYTNAVVVIWPHL